MEPEREPQEQGAPVGFLFGNVDEKNKLEADYLDEVSHFIAETVPQRRTSTPT